MTTEGSNPSGSFFNRQERISWWNQDRLSHARVMVAGAGALGNELLKNLALLGIGYMLVIDFDVIEDSNLSRAVLFRSGDVADNSSKALVAAERARQLNPNTHSIVQGINANLVWEIGIGVYRRMDVVIGCLDNLEARLKINENCWCVRKTWIDGGMWELSGNISVFDSSDDKACYECNMSPQDYYRAAQRYSCTSKTVKTRLMNGFEPTTQTTSAIIAAVQAQETVKLLHGINSFPGRKLVYNGSSHFYLDSEYTPMYMLDLTVNGECASHGEDRLDEILELPDACAETTTARQLLQMVGENWEVLELGRSFIFKAVCPYCENEILLDKPLYQIQDTDVVCPNCSVRCPTCGTVNKGVPDCQNCGQRDIYEPNLIGFDQLTYEDPLSSMYLDWPLGRLGIPKLHVLTIRDRHWKKRHVELTGDVSAFGFHNSQNR